jgi:hypothetical protein
VSPKTLGHSAGGRFGREDNRGAVGPGKWRTAEFVEHGEVTPSLVIGEVALSTGEDFAIEPVQ